MHFLEIRSKVKNYHISAAGVSFEILLGLFIKTGAGEHIFYIWQETIVLSILPYKTIQVQIWPCRKEGQG